MDAAADSPSSGVLVLWFSKDRALQLSEAIRTFTRFAQLAHISSVRHVVLYTCSSSDHARCYSTTAAALPSVAFVDEMCPPLSHSPNQTIQPTGARQQSHFAAQLRAIVDGSTEEFVLLCVDDVLFVAHFSLSAILPLFAAPELLCYNMALHPSLTFHHPSASPLSVPLFTSPSAGSQCTSPPTLLFSHSSGVGSHDFRYPFSLVASIYRLSDVRSIMRDLSRGTLPFHHPNVLESSVNSLITSHSAIPAAVRAFLPPPSLSDPSALSTLRPLSALPSRPLCVVVTVNRVQEVFSNAVFESADGGVGAMLQRFEAGGWQLDEDRYAVMAEQGHFNSVHVGELLWKQREEAAADRTSREKRGKQAG